MSNNVSDNPNTNTNAVNMDLNPAMFRTGNAEETRIAMQKPNIGVMFRQVNFSEVDGLALFEGDIVLAEINEVRAAQTKPEPRGIGIVGDQYRWKDGTIAYTTEEIVRSTVEAATKHWEEKTPFRFVKRTTEQDYIAFKRLNGCWSRVGRQGGEQTISIGLGCGLGAAIHEIGHALGLWHEQSRADRDDFIEIIKANIRNEHLHNFDKHILDGDDLGDYDYGSIMHYPATAFSNNGQPTIVVKQTGQPIGQRNGLSKGDIDAIRIMYGHFPWWKEPHA